MSKVKTKPERTWVVREADLTDREGILQCRDVTFAGEDLEKQAPAYWDWEFRDNHAGPARLFVAVDHLDLNSHEGAPHPETGEEAKSGKIVGHYAVIPQRFLLNGDLLNGSIVVDVMTHPDYRFQGMFTVVGRYAIEKCTQDDALEFTTGYPIRPEVLPGHLKVGWRERFKISIWAMPLSVGRIISTKYPKFKKLPGLAGLLGAIPTVLFRLNANVRLFFGGRCRTKRMDRCDSDLFGRFWKRFKERIPLGCVIQERTPEYLAWRFDRNPGRDYSYCCALDEKGEIEGFVVTRVIPIMGAEAMVVVDACAFPEQAIKVFRTLLGEVKRAALERGCPVCAMTLTQPNPIFPNPARFGFIRTPIRFTFITREFAETTRIDQDDLDWHLMWGDTDDA
ncbi:MAG: GNAT family N-acetyltransferase [Planctomycetota bacterium]